MHINANVRPFEKVAKKYFPFWFIMGRTIRLTSVGASIQVKSLSHERSPQFESLERRFRPALISFYYNRGLAIPDAEDLVQEVFVRLMATNLKLVDNIDGFVFQVAANLLKDQFRRLKTRRQTIAHLEILESTSVETADPHRRFSGRQELKAVTRCLDELPNKTRDIFSRSRLEGESVIALATEYGMSVRAVHKHLAKALAHLTSRLIDAEVRH